MWRNSREITIVSTEESGHTRIISLQVCEHWSNAAVTSLGPAAVRMGSILPSLLRIWLKYSLAVHFYSLNQLILTIRWLSGNLSMKWGWQCRWPHKEFGDRLTWCMDTLNGVWHIMNFLFMMTQRFNYGWNVGHVPRSSRYRLSL